MGEGERRGKGVEGGREWGRRKEGERVWSLSITYSIPQKAMFVVDLAT